MTQVRKLATGQDHVLVLMNDNTLYGVGVNSSGALGVSQTNIVTPRLIDTGVTDAYSSQLATAYYLKGNTLYASGSGSNGALMSGSTSSRASFAAVSVGGSTTNVASFAAGYFGNKILTTTGSVYVTGDQYTTGTAGAVISTPTLMAGVPTTSNGINFPEQSTYRSTILLGNGDLTKYYANPRMGRTVGLSSESGPGAYTFVEVLQGVDHSLTTGLAHYAGGTIVINNGYIYQCGLNRCFQSPQGTQDIVTPLTKTTYTLP